jgi:S1-C subfamily serine protease
LCRHCDKPLNIPAPGGSAGKPQTPPEKPEKPKQAVKAAPLRSIPVSPPPEPPRVSAVKKSEVIVKAVPVNNDNKRLWLLVGGGLAAFGLVVIGVVAIVAMVILKGGSTPPSASQDLAQQSTKTKPQDEPRKVEITKESPVQPVSGSKLAVKTTPKTNRSKLKDETATKSPKAAPKQTDNSVVAVGGTQLNKAVLDKVKKATVYIRVVMHDNAVAQGSGFFGIEGGMVLTNAHVIDMLEPDSKPPKSVDVVYQSGEPDSRTFRAKILGVDRNADLALLRVEGDNLPEPLDVKYAGDLFETQTVYVVGFPFGVQLGKNITVSPSSVTALRKSASGEIVKVQVNGGMQPGNSGGPVITAAGDVVGVSVSGIIGTQINFAVPGEFVHAVLNGRITRIRSGETVRDGSQLKVPVHLEVLDPLGRAQKVAVDWWTAAKGKARPPSDTKPNPAQGDSPHVELPVVASDGQGQAELVLQSELPAGQLVWVQPMIIDGNGKSRWSAPIAFVPSKPIEKEPATLSLKHYWGARQLTLVTSSNIKLSKPGAPDLDLAIDVNAKMAESMVGQQMGLAALRMRYLGFKMSMPDIKLMPSEFSRLKRQVQQVGLLHADLVVDDKNNLKQNKVDASKLPKELRSELTDLHSQIQEALEWLAVPLPGKLVQPGDTWKAKQPLMVFTGRKFPSTMDVTYTYLGTRLRDNNASEGVISIDGVATERLIGQDRVSGRVTGTANLDLSGNQISNAQVKATLNILDEKGMTMEVSLESKLARSLGKELLKVTGQLTAGSKRDRDGRPYKEHTVKLEAGKPCIVSMESFPGPAYFDTYVRVEDDGGAVLAEDDDSGVDSNALIVFTPRETGTYRIVATCFRPAAGTYLLVVRQ